MCKKHCRESLGFSRERMSNLPVSLTSELVGGYSLEKLEAITSILSRFRPGAVHARVFLVTHRPCWVVPKRFSNSTVRTGQPQHGHTHPILHCYFRRGEK
jgi:hypothetical protein